MLKYEVGDVIFVHPGSGSGMNRANKKDWEAKGTELERSTKQNIRCSIALPVPALPLLRPLN